MTSQHAPTQGPSRAQTSGCSKTKAAQMLETQLEMNDPVDFATLVRQRKERRSKFASLNRLFQHEGSD